MGNHEFFALYKTLVPTYLELQPVAAHLLVVRVYGVKPDDVGVVGAPLPAAAGGGAGDAGKSKKKFFLKIVFGKGVEGKYILVD